MRRSRALLVAAATVAMAIGAIGAPAAAANPRLAFVNGIPGRTVDVCVGNNEVKSGLRYGRTVQRSVAPGSPTVRFRAASPGNCQGSVIASESLVLAADDDLTVIGTAKSPLKVLVFDNTLAPVPAGNVCGLAVRHAANVGEVAIALLAGSFFAPTVTPIWEKGDQWRMNTSSVALLVAVSKPDKLRPFEQTALTNCFEGQRVEFILVGTTTRNARIVVLVRPTLPI